ncbi:hypothetical protein ABB28_14015 [Stenotrophomonas chelatiphaga]|uniref:Uncharacterized protein n=1 Tax=Stenotrophomonas chelatiphaga TaxID=517011 RepID=A0A0R0CSK4_9GAMM|nr:hypothetical protein [Stenotrophomonas chelatiphaga]KRG72783.1 hypothetical protein ABB28_14015 [Stenotrophomonas chelatiphaga]
MDLSFALITEGITDQAALEAIVAGHYKRLDPDIECDFTFVQPIRDKTDESLQGNFAGWERVLEKCSTPDVARNALAYSDYLIVQIDTDVGEQRNFGLALTENGVDIDETGLITAAKAIIVDRFGEVWEEIRDQTIMAICVHSLECWLLVLHAPAQDACSTKGCEARLSRVLARQNVVFDKEHDTYRRLSRNFRKPRHLAAAQVRSISLDTFLRSLPRPG